MAAMRDRLIRGYFGVDDTIVWDVVKTHIPTVAEVLRALADNSSFARLPPPRQHRHRYHGVFASNHRLRKAVTALAIANIGFSARGRDRRAWARRSRQSWLLRRSCKAALARHLAHKPG